MDQRHFKESGIDFHFSEEWLVQKYDDHRFYKYLSGRGFSGVDFISLRKGNQVVFWEIKNFIRRKAGGNHDPELKLIERPEQFHYEITEKVKDTILLIDTVKKYYLRKWWYRLLYPFFKDKENPKSDWLFWSRLEELIQQKGIHFILWMETDQVDTNSFTEPIQAQLIALNATIEIIHSKNNPYEDSIQGILNRT